MPRDGAEVRRRLQLAALDLYGERGYEQTTAAEIAARAGVTERTFFRHFADKREVVFEGEAEFIEALASAVRSAPSAMGPWDALLRAFRSVEPIFVANRALAERRRHILAGSAALQERQMGKTRLLIVALASALVDRAIAVRQAEFAAQVGMAALSHAFATWVDEGASEEGPGALGRHFERAFEELRTLSGSGSKPARPRKTPANRAGA